MPRSKTLPAEDWSENAAAFWRETTLNYTFNVSEMLILKELCRVITRLDRLQAAAANEPLVVPGKTGPTSNPLLVEARLLAQVAARLVAQLRIPDEVAVAPSRGAGQSRPQKRGAARGAYAGASYAPSDAPHLRSVEGA
ncbi:hypothetical protein CH298_23005 [Rhodococcoides fascians]|uniref:hypothetical protein n=1 Tax=Rhodococcoides fascians TaxID=1828 RepID=UPI000B9A427D|nr:hypothetical protein [Rhodococcus fascians]OZE85519.1 hypothetical protein CH303_23360 [Rhodococcus fascians]OZF12026.1 hypothetical protein CH298_23005 [Rhodococcus fascians]OZF14794.1 hypothetical protein CH297_23385 [Rhodococcus fascians]OZF61373.1 hypothetical protein CH308_23005 [Rhodococcus fascians]OZF64478.1 hypothetical protein CH307_23200 [Rhodococcus fascians]